MIEMNIRALSKKIVKFFIENNFDVSTYTAEKKGLAERLQVGCAFDPKGRWSLICLYEENGKIIKEKYFSFDEEKDAIKWVKDILKYGVTV